MTCVVRSKFAIILFQAKIVKGFLREAKGKKPGPPPAPVRLMTPKRSVEKETQRILVVEHKLDVNPGPVVLQEVGRLSVVSPQNTTSFSA
jgi:hypothetical protein